VGVFGLPVADGCGVGRQGLGIVTPKVPIDEPVARVLSGVGMKRAEVAPGLREA